MWRLIILAVAGSLIYGLPYLQTYYYDAYLQAYNRTNTQMGLAWLHLWCVRHDFLSVRRRCRGRLYLPRRS